MELTVYAAWLNEVFALFDSFFLGLHHELALAYGDILTPVANFLGAAGHFGVIFLALATLLLFFQKTRMAGVAIIVAIAIAGGLSEFFIKDMVDRPRPFLMSDTFNAWWQFVGSPDAHSSSFPSGHVAGCTAAVIALAYAARRWWVSLLGVIMIVLMAMDRMYLVVHYPSDVLGGFILGFVCGIIGYAIVQGVFRLLGKHPDQIADAKARASAHNYGMEIPRGMQAAGVSAGQPQPSYRYTATSLNTAQPQPQPRAAVQPPSRAAVAQPRTTRPLGGNATTAQPTAGIQRQSSAEAVGKPGVAAPAGNMPAGNMPAGSTPAGSTPAQSRVVNASNAQTTVIPPVDGSPRRHRPSSAANRAAQVPSTTQPTQRLENLDK